MGKFRDGQRVRITSGAHEGDEGTVIFPFQWSYAVRLDRCGEVIYEHNLAPVGGSPAVAEAARVAEEGRCAKARAADRKVEEEEAIAKAIAAIKWAEEEERAVQRVAERGVEQDGAALGQAVRKAEEEPRAEAKAAGEEAARRTAGRAATVDEDEPFEAGDAGAPLTYPMPVADIKRGSHLMVKGHPCKCLEVSTSKTGKHGHAKAHIVAVDVFTGKKYEDLFPSSHTVEVPHVKRTEYQLLNVDARTGEVSLLHDSGSIRDDLNLPTFVKTGEPTDEDRRLQREIVESFKLGLAVVVAVVSACGEEKILDAWSA
mmetsp:Transcript_83520/g.253483  ORF Transcript_83520/g.253483 Transcript_83520/m.253483 type:complete len:315 (+) Transcript_83520:124-1068(+)